MARGAGPVVRDAKKARTRRALVEHAVAPIGTAISATLADGLSKRP